MSKLNNNNKKFKYQKQQNRKIKKKNRQYRKKNKRHNILINSYRNYHHNLKYKMKRKLFNNNVF